MSVCRFCRFSLRIFTFHFFTSAGTSSSVMCRYTPKIRVNSATVSPTSQPCMETPRSHQNKPFEQIQAFALLCAAHNGRAELDSAETGRVHKPSHCQSERLAHGPPNFKAVSAGHDAAVRNRLDPQTDWPLPCLVDAYRRITDPHNLRFEACLVRA